ncbi:MAG: histidine phosphatase family protein [archaeon]|jgi:2,3-bisphosphoglycerate-dependent phosphoglycerate mutase
MKLSIILFRHGSVVSKKNIFCGWLNLPLNKEGESEAKELASKLKNERIDVAFCSDQLRSQECLVEVLKYHSVAKVIIDPRLRERHYGALTGKEKELERKKSASGFAEIHRGYYATVLGGENLFLVGKRVFPFMNDLLKFMQKEKCSVAISAHTNSLRLIQEYLEGLTPRQATLFEHHPAQYKKYLVEFN